MRDEPATAHGTTDHAGDPRNADILVNVDGRLVPRAQAVVSVFDAGFVLGDGVWEGLRVSGGHPASTGFAPYAPRRVVLDGDARVPAERSRPHYERRYEARVRL